MALLEIDNLDVWLETAAGPAQAVRGLNVTLERGRTLGIVGESGCGKSMTALAIMGLLPEGATTRGQIRLNGEDLLSRNDDALCHIRGDRIAMIFQEPMTSLNPVQPIGRQVMEPLQLHRGMSRQAAREEAIELLDRVGMPNPTARMAAYPHQLSGGQRQRVMIAIALSCRPDILIADEPTTALDVTIQGQILDLIAELAAETGMALILISHDLGVIAETTARMAVMYGGALVEEGATESVFANLAHPYTQGLFAAIPRLGARRAGKLETIAGVVPELIDLPRGCTFADRCPLTTDACRDIAPPATPVGPDHSAACIHLDRARLKRRQPVPSS